MASPFDTFMASAAHARKLAAEYRRDAANEASASRKTKLLIEATRADERADDYEMRASWYAPKIRLEKAA